jgi:hypothetical protein
MRLAVAAISCGFVSFLAACSGGPSAPAGAAGATNSSPGPFAPVAAAGPFAPVTNPSPFAPAAAAGPFAPVPDPGPFAVNPPATTGGGTVAEACATACGRAVELGCPVANCETGCVGGAAQLPEACHPAFATWILCLAENATCGDDGGTQGSDGCNAYQSAYQACALDAIGGRPNGPPVVRDAAAYVAP